MNNITKFFLLSAAIINVFCFSYRSVSAASEGCNSIPYLSGTYTSTLENYVTAQVVASFVEGETLTLIVTEVSGELDHFEFTLTKFEDDYPSYSIDKYIKVPGTAVYTIKEDGFYNIGVLIYYQEGVAAILAFCIPPEKSLPAANLLDGRLNKDQAYDVAAPIALYDDNALNIYAIDPETSEGTLVLNIPADVVTSASILETNLVLAEATNPFTGQLISVWILTSGELQLSTFYPDGKPYVIVWPIDAPEQMYHLDQ